MKIQCMNCGEEIEYVQEYRYYKKVYCHDCSIDFKKDEIKKLANKRQTNCYPGFDPIPPKYDCGFVSPNSKKAHNYDAKIMIMGQDWADNKNIQDMERNLKKQEETIKFGYSPSEPYSKKLFALLDRHFCINFDETFATNLFPFIRTKKDIPPVYMRKAAEEYAKSQIEIIQPKILLCFGDATYKSLENVLNIGSRNTIDESIENPLSYNPFDYSEIYLFWLTHLGSHSDYNRGIKKVNDYPGTGEGGWFLKYRKINKFGEEEPDYNQIGKIQNEKDWKKISDFFKHSFPMFDKC